MVYVGSGALVTIAVEEMVAEVRMQEDQRTDKLVPGHNPVFSSSGV